MAVHGVLYFLVLLKFLVYCGVRLIGCCILLWCIRLVSFFFLNRLRHARVILVAFIPPFGSLDMAVAWGLVLPFLCILLVGSR